MKKKKNDKTKSTKSSRAAIITLWSLFVGLLSIIVLFFYGIAQGWFGAMPTFEELENPQTNLATEIISADGKVLGTYYIENRSNVSFDELSPHLVEALLSIEDARFKQHSGIDIKALFRVAFGVMTGKKQGGGSTLTQQLAKNLFPRNENLSTIQLIIRKFQEWVTATKLEYNYSKDEILAMYLNTVAYGHNAYGIKSAAETFFAKRPSELNIEESALLTGIVNAPTRLSPIRNPKNALNRRNSVINKMATYGYISQEAADSICQIPIDMSKFTLLDHNTGQATYFREFLRGELTEWAKTHTKANGQPYNIYKDGLKIYTTIDSRMQRYAEEAVREHMGNDLQPSFYKHWKGYTNAPFDLKDKKEIDNIMELSMKRSERYRVLKKNGMCLDSIKANFNKPAKMKVFSWDGVIDTIMTPMDSIRYYKYFLQASLMSVESHTGHIKAYVGGLDYRFFKYDHVMQARRQVGSTFKPFLYSLAMQEGEFTPCTKIPNIQYSIPLPDGTFWEPRNSGGTHVGEEVTLKWALAQSNNWISAYLMNRFGPNAVIGMARRMGVESPIEEVPSICLGVADLKLSEMVGAMNTFANRGVYVKPMFITRIEDKNGNVIERFFPQESEAMDEITAYKMVELLKGVVQSGTGIRLKYKYKFNNPIAGKTGTTQNQSDGYFMGLTPDLTTGVWVGGEDRSIHFRTIKLGQGSNMALPIWALYMRKVYDDKNLKISQGDFRKPITNIDLNFDCESPETETQERSSSTNQFIDEF